MSRQTAILMWMEPTFVCIFPLIWEFLTRPLQVEVVSDVKVLEKEYPCLAAVNRCANCNTRFYCWLQSQDCFYFLDDTWLPSLHRSCPAGVPRHQGRVIKLLYCGEGPIQKTLMLVGKVRPHSVWWWWWWSCTWRLSSLSDNLWIYFLH